LPTGWLASCDADGQLANAAPCAQGMSCVEGACVSDVVEMTPMDPAGVMGGGEPPPPVKTLAPVSGGCSSAPGLLGLALVTLFLRRRR